MANYNESVGSESLTPVLPSQVDIWLGIDRESWLCQRMVDLVLRQTAGPVILQLVLKVY